jgi:hypothetical protein
MFPIDRTRGDRTKVPTKRLVDSSQSSNKFSKSTQRCEDNIDSVCSSSGDMTTLKRDGGEELEYGRIRTITILCKVSGTDYLNPNSINRFLSCSCPKSSLQWLRLEHDRRTYLSRKGQSESYWSLYLLHDFHTFVDKSKTFIIPCVTRDIDVPSILWGHVEDASRTVGYRRGQDLVYALLQGI